MGGKLKSIFILPSVYMKNSGQTQKQTINGIIYLLMMT